ncbi:MAG: tol-pal system protein YbgF [Alphaproteobacteria bacterium]|nr:tol-pal system protein YbgF [Alphaproteobacteria bacterium]
MKLLSTILCFMFFSSFAQAQEIIGMQEQIDAIKEEMMFLQKKIYRDKVDSEVLESNPARAEVKIGEYDQIIRNLNGKIEEIEHKLKTLDEKIDTVNKDIDIRFRLLEGKPIPAGQASAQVPQKFDTAVANGAPKSITGDNITTSDLQNLEPEKTLSVQQIYTTGLEALKSGDSKKAEAHFNMILNNHQTDKLAGNAQYWLGEVYYKDRKFDKAAVAFAKGYNDYKNGAKGADCLLKLGLSMAQLGKKDEACLAFVNLPTEFAKAPDNIKAKAKNEAKKMGCE